MRISDWSSDVCSSDLDGSARSWLRQDRTQLRNGLRSSSGQCQVVASPCRQSAAGQSHGFRFGYATAVVTQGAAMMQKDASVGGKAPDIGTLMVMIGIRSEEHTSELQSLMRISYAVFCLKKKNQ